MKINGNIVCNIKKLLLFKLSFSSSTIAAGEIASLLTLTGYLGGFFWLFDITSHFKMQYLVCLAVICGLLIYFKKYRWSAVFSIFLIFNLMEIAPLYFHSSPVPPGDGRISLKIMCMNVHTGNQEYATAISRVLEESPDILILEEVDNIWLANLDELRKNFEYEKSFPQSDNFGIALFSRIKPEKCEVLAWGEYQLPYIEATYSMGGKELKVWAVHTLPPISRTYSEVRNLELDYFGKALKNQTGNRILLGDLNITPWSVHFRRFLKESGMRNSMEGFGVQPSWPTMNPLLLVPIDHCVVSPEIYVTGRRIGKRTGSDHYPLIVEMTF
jgi:endonuclease/exonuclease/phosphatase (EEP) superfamily protein YafD